jgi:nucleoside-diphosphate-sugar epimerase
MRITVLGGTAFIGRAVVEELAMHGHEVTVVHRGETEPEGWVAVEHLHLDRAELPERAAELAALHPDAVIDTYAMTRADAEAAVSALPDVPVVVLSSLDVYLAFGELLAGRGGQPVPIDEDAPLRRERYPHRARGGEFLEYDKLDVEEVYGRRQATICRLPVIFGPYDPERREEFILRRVRAGRRRIPFGDGSWLCTRLHVADTAAAVRAVVETPDVDGRVFNIAPPATLTIRQWVEAILAAAAHDAELIRVPDDALPRDLRSSTSQRQHLLVVPSRKAEVFGWTCGDPGERIAQSVAWHLDHPPAAQGDVGLSEDDRALSAG